MNGINIYPADIQKNMQYFSTKHYIPIIIKSDEHCKLYKRYWNSYDKISFKVENIFFTDDGSEYYEIKYIKYYNDNGLMYGIKPYPLENNTYELKYDSREIDKLEEKDIINSKKSLLGAEIKYWFYINNIDLLSDRYNGFSSYLEYGSLSQISDDKFYLLFAEDDIIYKDCKVVLDKYKEYKE